MSSAAPNRHKVSSFLDRNATNHTPSYDNNLLNVIIAQRPPGVFLPLVRILRLIVRTPMLSDLADRNWPVFI
jgi:hypothetical protein